MVAGKFEEIRAKTESLSESEKIILADILLSNSGMSGQADVYWKQELKNRAARLKNGALKTISLEEFSAKHETGQAVS